MLLVLLIAALAPGVSRALAHAQGTPWLQICSVSDEVSRDGQPAAPARPSLDHCLYCGLAHDQPALPTIAAPGPWPELAVAAPAAAATAVACAAMLWPAGQARAPPAHG